MLLSETTSTNPDQNRDLSNVFPRAVALIIFQFSTQPWVHRKVVAADHAIWASLLLSFASLLCDDELHTRHNVRYLGVFSNFQ